MLYRPLGRCGTKVSLFSLGGWTTYGESVADKQTIRDIIRSAFEAGVNYFDISDVYNKGETEKAMGEVLREFPRHELVIASKVFFPMSDDVNDRGLSRKHIMESIDKSLQRIGVDYLDLYFCHRWDDKTPLEETARAMDDLVHRGKIFYWGTSDWNGRQLQDVHALCRERNLYAPQVEQPRYSLLARKPFESDVAPAAASLGMGLVTFSPLAYGVLTGKYDGGIPSGARLDRIEWLRGRYNTDACLQKVRDMKRIARDVGCTRSQLALAWIASHPGVSSVITGATRLEQLRENLGALTVQISDDVKRQLDVLFANA
ncbi:MAG: aldo/keto reductase family protein [Candidatus Omnitrophica bacterium]|nr:aldo/keto reductase family protein [Candidatus Omnitrophota bacterium]